VPTLLATPTTQVTRFAPLAVAGNRVIGVVAGQAQAQPAVSGVKPEPASELVAGGVRPT